MDSKRKRFYSIFTVLFLMIVVTSATYAYLQVMIMDNSIVGSITNASVSLTVTDVFENTEKLVPQLESTLGTAIDSTHSCHDNSGQNVCRLYKVTLTNTGDSKVVINGFLKFDNVNTLPNLSWKLIDGEGTTYTIGSYDRHEASVRDVKFTDTPVILNTINDKEDFYILIWLNEIGVYQSDSGDFRATVSFKNENGNGVTSDLTDDSDSHNNEPNSPVLNGLIPVYYDDSSNSWKKAPTNNTDNKWYDYKKKRWANAVLVNNAVRSTYASASEDTVINEAHIIGYYVWIPRYKYRVWNISRQAGSEGTYAYPAYTEGIDIIFESGDEPGGNVTCTYNTASTYALKDECYISLDDATSILITDTTPNSKYTNAWYTHPAFKLGNTTLDGFWIGKFETTGTKSTSTTVGAPTILPDVKSLRNMTVSEAYKTARDMETLYSLGTNANSHMLMNTEWGAVAYLTHSKYGLCDGYMCTDPLFNNSTDFYTGRSSGRLPAANLGIQYGNYNYQGYLLDELGTPFGIKYQEKFASTTGNITGIYDMAGGAWEYVMAVIASSSSSTTPLYMNSGTFTPSSEFYNLYAYGTSNTNKAAFDRARLGDATAEVALSYGGASAWRNTTAGGAGSGFAYSSYPWFVRGGYWDNSGSGVFNFYSNAGGSNGVSSFRLVLSPTS